MKTKSIAVLASLLIAAGPPVAAETLSFTAAMAFLKDHTWSGTNASGDRFWFWHVGEGGSGKFSAKFSPNDASTSYGKGIWSIEASKICWKWEGWETFCYTKFERDGESLSMTRTDGVVHQGRRMQGNTEGL